MKRKILFLLASASLVLASSLKIENAYVRATAPNLINSAAFMEIKNTSNKDISLISAESKVSNVVELHTHEMEGGVMKMYQVPKIDIKANSTTVLKPGGFHVMLIDLKTKPLKENTNVELILNFSNKEQIKVIAPVKKVMSGMKMHKHMKEKKMTKHSCGEGKCGENAKCGS